jgi:PHD/YefM family antitoxin component YafN of YafNO toxin-antitoxin module
MSHIPFIDPSVKHIGVSKLRKFNASSLRETSDTFVIEENDSPLAVLLSYEKYLILQEQLMSVMSTIDMMSNQADVSGVREGLKAVSEGHVRSLADIRKDLKKRG